MSNPRHSRHSGRVPNRHGMPSDQWVRWSDLACEVFNATYVNVTNLGPSEFMHLDTIARDLSADEMNTIAWNCAWLAADQFDTPGATVDHVVHLRQGRDFK